MNNNNDIHKYQLSKGLIIFIFVFYLLLICIGVVVTVLIICKLSDEYTNKQLIIYTFISSACISEALCSVQYVRRLYKSCITEQINENASYIVKLGNIAYFVLRPIFAAVFSVVIVLGMLSGLFIVTGNLDYIINEKFTYMCVIVSSAIGYSIGRVLDKFEEIINGKFNKIS